VAPWAVLGALGLRCLWTSLLEAPQWVRNPIGPVLLLGLGGDLAFYLLRSKVPGAEQFLTAALVVWPLAVGLVWLGMRQARPALACVTIITAVAVFHCLMWIYRAECLSQYGSDTAFIERTRRAVPADQPIYVKADAHPLNGSWLLFYLGDRATLLHNLTFLRDQDIHEHTLYLVARLSDKDELKQYGASEVIDSSAFTRGQLQDCDRYALFRFTYRDDLERVAASRVRITPCQATGRAKGPYLE
jgi:hypothetical protein